MGSSNLIGRELDYLNLEPIWALLRMPVPACPIAKVPACTGRSDTVLPSISPRPEVPVNTEKTSAIKIYICQAYSEAEFNLLKSIIYEDSVEEPAAL